MPGPIVNQDSVVLCAHAGQATPVAPFTRVLVGGTPVVTLSTPYVVAGCGLSASGTPPCVTGQWLVGAMRVTAGGTPVAVQSGTGITTPTGTPLLPIVVQPRVSAT